MTTQTKDLPIVGYYGLNTSGYEVIALKENHVLRMFDAGELTAQPVCLVSDALEAIRASATSAPDHIVDVTKLVPLSDEQLREAAQTMNDFHGDTIRIQWKSAKLFARAIEAAHGISITPQPAEGETS